MKIAIRRRKILNDIWTSTKLDINTFVQTHIHSCQSLLIWQTFKFWDRSCKFYGLIQYIGCCFWWQNIHFIFSIALFSLQYSRQNCRIAEFLKRFVCHWPWQICLNFALSLLFYWYHFCAQNLKLALVFCLSCCLNLK